MLHKEARTAGLKKGVPTKDVPKSGGPTGLALTSIAPRSGVPTT
jgi:hypothetical protein